MRLILPACLLAALLLAPPAYCESLSDEWQALGGDSTSLRAFDRTPSRLLPPAAAPRTIENAPLLREGGFTIYELRRLAPDPLNQMRGGPKLSEETIIRVIPNDSNGYPTAPLLPAPLW
jgi:hypothetical protein